MKRKILQSFFIHFFTGGLLFILLVFFHRNLLHISYEFKFYVFPFIFGGIFVSILLFLKYQNSQLRKAEVELQRERERFEQYLELADVIFVVIDATGKVEFINKRGCEILGCSKHEIIGKSWIDHFVPDRYREENKQVLHELLTEEKEGYYENWMRTNGGEEERFIAWHNKLIKDDKGNVLGLLAAGQDITHKKKIEEQLKRYASIDSMTDALNRRAGLNLLEKQMRLADRNGSALTVCFIDANGLKKVNDQFGHQEGDEYIIRVNKMLKEVLRESDTIIRMGGDEFLIVLPECTYSEAQYVWERFQSKLDTFNSKHLKPYVMSVSRGCEEYLPNSKVSVEQLLAVVDKKMYEDKENYKKKDLME